MNPRRLISTAATWHVESQQVARRNALVASTALTERRRERLEVEEFLERHTRRHPRAGLVSGAVPGLAPGLASGLASGLAAATAAEQVAAAL